MPSQVSLVVSGYFPEEMGHFGRFWGGNGVILPDLHACWSKWGSVTRVFVLFWAEKWLFLSTPSNFLTSWFWVEVSKNSGFIPTFLGFSLCLRPYLCILHIKSYVKMRIIVAGGRDFGDYSRMVEYLDMALSSVTVDCIVSGCARGADSLGERYAAERGYSIVRYPADWAVHGKAAGPLRNRLMAANADALVAFWDGNSRGTADMIDVARAGGLRVRVVRY